jgi:hypothetical protein
MTHQVGIDSVRNRVEHNSAAAALNQMTETLLQKHSEWGRLEDLVLQQVDKVVLF